MLIYRYTSIILQYIVFLYILYFIKYTQSKSLREYFKDINSLQNLHNYMLPNTIVHNNNNTHTCVRCVRCVWCGVVVWGKP